MPRAPKYRDANDSVVFAQPVVEAYQTFQLATNVAIAATSPGPAPVTGVSRGSYIWDAQFTGTSLTLQALGSDGVTWRDVANRTTPGATAVTLGHDAQVRLFNPNATGLTAVSANLT